MSDDIKVTRRSLEGTVVKLDREHRLITLTVKSNDSEITNLVNLPITITTDFELVPYAQAFLHEQIRYAEEVTAYGKEYLDHFSETRHAFQIKLEILSGKLHGTTYEYFTR
ncbi:MAG: hypothetical protein AABW48_00535 [Nanoarchaeota archaeon]